jgi:hypothetical protein
MENVWFLAATWLGLALIATLAAIWFKVSTAAVIGSAVIPTLIANAAFMPVHLRRRDTEAPAGLTRSPGALEGGRDHV